LKKLKKKFGAEEEEEEEEEELVKGIKIPGINDVPITASNFR